METNILGEIRNKYYHFDYNAHFLQVLHIIDVLKVSTGKWYQCIFPYNKNGKLISQKELENESDLYNYMLSQKENLIKRDAEAGSDWYGFGRTQAINDVKYYRIGINSLYKDVSDVKVTELPAGSGCFSGLYIMSEFSYDDMCKALVKFI